MSAYLPLILCSVIQGFDLNVIHSECGIIGDPKQYPLNDTPLIVRTIPTIPDEDHVEEPPPPTSKQKQDHVDSLRNEDIDGSRHVEEEPPTSKQKPSASTQNCFFHSITQNKTNTIIGVNLTPGAITKIMADKCCSTDLKPVVHVTNILSGRLRTKNDNDKPCYRKVVLSDGSSSHFGCIADDIIRSNKLQEGFIVQLTKFYFTKYYGDIRVLLINDLNVIHSKSDNIVNPEPFPRNDIPLVERSTSPITDDDHVDVSQSQESVTLKENCSETQSRKWKHQSSNKTPESDTTEDVDNSHNAPPITDEDHVDVSRSQEPVTSKENCSEIQSRKRKHQSSNETPEFDTNEDADNSHSAQEPSATTQKCSSHSLTQSKTRKHQTSNDNISKVVEVSKMTKMMMEKNKQDDVGACFKKMETLEEDVSKLATMMIEKNKEDDVGACFKKLETLEKDISKVTRTVMEKNKEDVGACFKKLETLEKDVSKMAKTVMDRNKNDDVGACFKKLETLEADVSKMAGMMIEKNKDDVGACFKKLETLEKDVSKLTRMMMEKNKEDDVAACFKKLETFEEDVSKLTRMMMEKDKEDDVAGFKKLETLEEDVSKLTRMMMEKDKEDGVAGFKMLETLEEDVSKLTRMMMDKTKEDVVGFKKLETLEEDVSKLTRMMMEKSKEDDMGACIEKLDKMGWGAEEPIYDTALLLFGQSSDYRKLWLHLKPESCVKWVKNAGNMFGLLD